MDGNRAAFAAAVETLTQLGLEPVSPWDIPGEHNGPCANGKINDAEPEGQHRYGCYLMMDLLALARCDAIFLLRGWQESPGARAERAFAEALGLQIIDGEVPRTGW
jgi:hypothetical protein